MNLPAKLEDLPFILVPILVIISCLVIGLLFEHKVITKLLKISQTRELKLSEIILQSLRGFSVVWFLILGFSIALSLPSYPIFPALNLFIRKILIISFLGSTTWVIALISVGLLRLYTTRDDGISPLTSLFEFLAKVLIFTIGFLIILQSIGISITPLLTAFGIGGVSIGLALQNTLSNLMSGINIITSKKVRPGDYIQLKSGESGYVIDVDLKYTIVQEITNNLLVIPNTQIITSSFRNYSLPNKSLLIPVDTGVTYDSDLEQVEAVTLEVVREILDSMQPEVAKSYQPFIRYNRFDYSSIILTVYLKVQEDEFFEHIEVKHEFIKKLHQRYKDEGIKISYPLQWGYFPRSDRDPFLNNNEPR
ncbi:MAG: hypothetical protein N5P05_003858 [Chroococcopsis gigantea SAG 12.99]|jgi:small-conductance mechanosensitive channel|nr:mechanosensitive ion channel family protein [Chlorogloea purpurea SAG 13.99]MDV3002252.1 hypothetical protein [Chroococcopsis gigantea SAG 12.99]